MRAAAITAPGVVQVLDRAQPQARGDLVVVKILVAPTCTEFKQRTARTLSDTAGHEAAGVIMESCSSRRFPEGDRVAVRPHRGCGLCEPCTTGDHMHCLTQRDVLAETGQGYGTANYTQHVLKFDDTVAA